MSRGKAEAAIQGRRAAQRPADSWARFIFTLEPEEKTNLTNGKGFTSRNPGIKSPLRQRDVLAAFPWPPSHGKFFLWPREPGSGLAQLLKPRPQAHHTGWQLETGLSKQVRNVTGWAPCDLPPPLSQWGRPPCHGKTGASPISETTQRLLALLPPATAMG